jgi:hypothetical protein
MCVYLCFACIRLPEDNRLGVCFCSFVFLYSSLSSYPNVCIRSICLSLYPNRPLCAIVCVFFYVHQHPIPPFCPYVYSSINPCTHLSACLCVYLFIHLLVCFSLYAFQYVPVCSSDYLPTPLSVYIYLFFSRCAHLPTCMSFYLPSLASAG